MISMKILHSLFDTANDLFELNDQITSIQIMLDDPINAPLVAEDIIKMTYLLGILKHGWMQINRFLPLYR